MKMTRRQLFAGSGAAGIGLGLGIFGVERWLTSDAIKASQKIFIGHCSPQKYLDHNNYLAVTEIETGLNYRIPTDSLPHGILKHSEVADTVVCLPKFGSIACEVNWSKKIISQKFYASLNREFYGHGFFSKQGNALFSTEVDTLTGRGVLTARESTNYAPIGEIETFGVGPHDCRVLADGKTLIVANSGNYILPASAGNTNSNPRASRVIEKSSLAWIDLNSGKLLQKIELPLADICMGHFEISDNILVAITLPQPAKQKDLSLRLKNCVYVSVDQGPLISADQVLKNDGFAGEMLSICIHAESMTALITNPDGKNISFWDIRNKKLMKKLEMDVAPTGGCVIPNQPIFVVSNHRAELVYINAVTLEPMQKVLTAGVGSHLYMLI